MTDSPIQFDLYTAEQVRVLDRYAIDVLGIPGFELMRRAAGAAFASLCRHWPQARHIGVLCGPGNNGGDGYLVGALALEAGFTVDLIALAAPRGDDALQARAAFEQAGGVARPADAVTALPDAQVFVDALYGTGLSRAVEPLAAGLIKLLNASGRPVLALDVPSGLSADTGVCLGDTVKAAVTVSFIAWKRGLFTHQAEYAGELELQTLGLPAALWATQSADAQLMRSQALGPRPRDSNKGMNGHVLAIGGDRGTGGAIRMAAEAALRVGAGLVSVATREEHIVALNAARPELMVRGVDGPQSLAPMIERATVLAVGPGLGQGAWGHALWLTALDACKPMVLDADGLNMLAAEPRKFSTPTVLTPHPGEAGRLLGMSTTDVQADRFAAAREMARHFGAVVVLKGSGSLVASPDGQVAVCRWGNPGMASGGMGDVLTGVVAALLAQGCDAWKAACMGVALHARAGDRAARAGERGLLASDLLGPLRALVNGSPDD